MRSAFLSRMVFQTYNGYVMSQFKKMQADLRNQGQVKWKHVMHLIRLLISGISVLRHGFVPVRMDEHREQLLAVKRGDMAVGRNRKMAIEPAPAIRQGRAADRPCPSGQTTSEPTPCSSRPGGLALLEELP